MASATTKERIVAQWRACIDPLAGDAALAENVSSARFANPAAYHVNNTAESVVQFALTGEGEEAAQAELEDLGRLFALRVTPPSASLKCFFDLRNFAAAELAASSDSEDLSAVQQRIDTCMLYAIDSFMASREKLSSIAYDELKKRNEMLEKLANDYTTGGEQS